MRVDPNKVIKIAAVQAEPAWLDLRGGVDKVIRLVEEAASAGAELLAFPEVFVPGYPWFLWTRPYAANADLIHKYFANSMDANGSEMAKIRRAVRKAGITIVLGYSERSGSSIYMAQSAINPNGDIVMHRRKIKPTAVERALWGEGQGESIMNVFQTDFGRVGALNCWEHLQPLLRYHEYSQGAHFHAASWPAMFPAGAMPLPYQHSSDANQDACRFMAIEGQMFVLVSTQVMSPEGAETLGIDIKAGGFPLPGGGFSTIFDPTGEHLTEKVDPGKEAIIYANVSLQTIDYAKAYGDPVGHYSRPDLLSLQVNDYHNPHVRHTNTSGGSQTYPAFAPLEPLEGE